MGIILRAGLALSVLVTASCGDAGLDAEGLRVVAALGPLEEAAIRVGGDAVIVEGLTPPGVEPHDLELTPGDLETLAEADVVLYLGGGFQPALEDALPAAASAVVVDLRPAAGPFDGVLQRDPHVWLDPARYALIVDAVGEAFASADPANADGYRSRATAFADELTALDAAFTEGLATCDRRLLVTGHEAFGFLAAAYGLEQAGVTGLSPEAEPTPARLAEIHALVERQGVTTVYAESRLPADTIEAIARDTGAVVGVLDPLEVRTDEGYVARMTANLSALREGLGCA